MASSCRSDLLGTGEEEPAVWLSPNQSACALPDLSKVKWFASTTGMGWLGDEEAGRAAHVARSCPAGERSVVGAGAVRTVATLQLTGLIPEPSPRDCLPGKPCKRRWRRHERRARGGGGSGGAGGNVLFLACLALTTRRPALRVATSNAQTGDEGTLANLPTAAKTLSPTTTLLPP